ncbi:hypothetical protein [Virgibacillus halodenitrificans]|uniref:hypothetical protein n=1 Tax=Virgibacillus halodenitrificans TaxID=1482 RepID=UPI001F1D76A4|nr:hypothetical protein [Virgibacillus halodenitrificans]
MILLAGITGFQPAPSTKEKDFKAICYSSLDSDGVEFVETKGFVKNFYECVIKMKSKRVHALLNSQYPFIAFTSSRQVDELNFPFIDDVKLSNIFSPYYEVLCFEQLNEPVRYHRQCKNIILDNENTLHQVELKQLAYWKPKTVGEIVFNYWD